MLFSPTPTEQQVLQLCDGTSLMSETEVTVLGVTIDDKLCFSQHISVCCKKAARQLNALARISKHLNINSRRAIYNSFIVRNYSYCPLVWHFCGQVNNQKLKKIQERALGLPITSPLIWCYFIYFIKIYLYRMTHSAELFYNMVLWGEYIVSSWF